MNSKERNLLLNAAFVMSAKERGRELIEAGFDNTRDIMEQLTEESKNGRIENWPYQNIVNALSGPYIRKN